MKQLFLICYLSVLFLAYILMLLHGITSHNGGDSSDISTVCYGTLSSPMKTVTHRHQYHIDSHWGETFVSFLASEKSRVTFFHAEILHLRKCKFRVATLRISHSIALLSTVALVHHRNSVLTSLKINLRILQRTSLYIIT